MGPKLNMVRMRSILTPRKGIIVETSGTSSCDTSRILTQGRVVELDQSTQSCIFGKRFLRSEFRQRIKSASMEISIFKEKWLIETQSGYKESAESGRKQI